MTLPPADDVNGATIFPGTDGHLYVSEQAGILTQGGGGGWSCCVQCNAVGVDRSLGTAVDHTRTCQHVSHCKRDKLVGELKSD